ncbi:hypothetical protein HMPREF1092_03264 [Clostridium thermobutyricum]|uniref:HTH cro/C1-type domain-containing protein n=1 Tax=Clostridium thermobutyricum TaxID=29372 RepID=N9W7D8_9CLOT|nr:helix-turn-helix transcriptional regulator [Clostridium thermobutyricum]ENY98784.1 hypothetical protein HMPREF1092_03264 [Clostridium thermobutyricum]
MADIIDILNNLNKLRKSQELSTYELSELSGISQSTISKLENNKKNLTVEELQILLNCMNSSLESFFSIDTDYDKNLINNFNLLSISNKNFVQDLISKFLIEQSKLSKIKPPKNILITGAVGAGKSYRIKQDIKSYILNFCTSVPNIYFFSKCNFAYDLENNLDEYYPSFFSSFLKEKDLEKFINTPIKNKEYFFDKLKLLLNKEKRKSVIIMESLYIPSINDDEIKIFKNFLMAKNFKIYITSQDDNVLDDFGFEVNSLIEHCSLIRHY